MTHFYNQTHTKTKILHHHIRLSLYLNIKNMYFSLIYNTFIVNLITPYESLLYEMFKINNKIDLYNYNL